MPDPIKPTAADIAAAKAMIEGADLRTLNRYEQYVTNAFALHAQHAREQALEEAAWKPLTDTAWLDGRDIILLAYDMEVQARYCPGEWSDDTPINPREYSGAVWSCFDDQFQIEIEEISHDPAEWHHGQATHWRALSSRPALKEHQQ